MASTDNLHIPRDIEQVAHALPPHPAMASLDNFWTRVQALRAFLATVDPHPDDVIYGYPGLLTRAQRVIARLIAEREAQEREWQRPPTTQP
jgi:hypothetical protein